ncbi:hypothetical protein EWM64_g8202 [Hericium alpestre]|uniref:Metallo-beta-lactamase domain-containing protein n=1 Tax=Hericium alpestre TaxID=135208 RepID=A0A4Y9ZM05_9AGAM|nr:hypothetical protein EWM64_g8202 [Hericium alpestre]
MPSTLPPPRPNQPFFTVSALEGGRVTCPAGLLIDPVPEGVDKLVVPATPFLLRHSLTKQNILFDLGVRKDYNNLPPALAKRVNQTFQPVDVSETVVDALAKGGLTPAEISHVFLSHIHWDHIGDTALFPYSTLVAGDAAAPLVEHGYPHDPESLFDSALLPPDRTVYLHPSGWGPVGPFPRAIDYYGDGSLYIVDAPGHLAGHYNFLVRTSADGGWMYLGGDMAHDLRIITGELKVPVYHNAQTGLTMCMHADKGAAEEHIARVRKLLSIPRVRITIAHNKLWYDKARDGPEFWPRSFKSL